LREYYRREKDTTQQNESKSSFHKYPLNLI